MPRRVDLTVGRFVTQMALASMPMYQDTRWLRYINDLGNKIVGVSERPNFNYRFIVADTSEINAFASPDGSVFITTGLLKLCEKDEDQIVAVLAHEVSHIALRHGAKMLQKDVGYGAIAFAVFGFEAPAGRQVANFVSQLTSLGYGRDFELEADARALVYLKKMSYKETALADFLEKIKHLDPAPTSLEKYLRSHPPTVDRIQAIQSSSVIPVETGIQSSGRE